MSWHPKNLVPVLTRTLWRGSLCRFVPVSWTADLRKVCGGEVYVRYVVVRKGNWVIELVNWMAWKEGQTIWMAD